MTNGAKVNFIKCFVMDKPLNIDGIPYNTHQWEHVKSEVIHHDGGSFTVKYNLSVDRTQPPVIKYCAQCKYAVDVSTKLYTCDGDMEDVVYCRYHDVICKSMRQGCDWSVASDE